MVIDERSRHELFIKLEEVLGSERATTLMEHLPPVGWADVATKSDLDQLRVATKSDLDQLVAGLRSEIRHLEREFGLALEATEQRLLATLRKDLVSQTNAQTRAMILTMTTSILSVAGIAFAAARLV